MGHKTSPPTTKTANVNSSPPPSALSPAAAERRRLNKIFTRLALSGWAVLAVITFLAVTGLCDFAILDPTSTANADDTHQTTAVKVAVETSCLLSATTESPHTTIVSNGTTESDIGQTQIQTVCNDGDGWSIYAVGYSNDTLGDTSMHAANSEATIATGLSTSGSTSAWAMKIGIVPGLYAPTLDYGTPDTSPVTSGYNVIPSTATKVAHYNGMTTSADASTITTTYRVFASAWQGAGTYTGKVKYMLVHPSEKTPGDITTLTYMQDIDSTICQDFTTTGTTATLIDSRDGKSYTVAKLNDGNCWMTQNLDLDLDENIPLTPATSNVSDNWTPLRSTIEPGQLSSTTWQNDNYTPYSYDSGNTTNGNYYNWSAAIASNDSSSITSGDAPGSICPRGWRLPSQKENELGKMLYAHGVVTSPTGDYATGGWQIFRSDPLSFTSNVYITNGSFGGRGTLIYSTAASSAGAYYEWDNGSSWIRIYREESRALGSAVRCLAA